ncbi:MAG: UDP-3-O-(3-hydroxymyristoyl)glucosamine N-acyltransferase [Planctomycetaceae bacterium]|nr:UDP-3-O-(3-hydroxymyristoyl)glucosamine N-acyltransferase [Planctomycetaceae bacterium]
MTLTVEQISVQVAAEVRGDASLTISGAAALDKAREGEIAFVANASHSRNLKNCEASALLVNQKLSQAPEFADVPQTLLIVEDAKQAFLRVLEIFHPPRRRASIGISSHATVHPLTRIGHNTNVHPGAHIAEDVVIGENCEIHPGVCIGPGCRIGDEVTIYPNAVIYHDVILGNRVIIHAGAVIGADGFGYQLLEGRHKKLPHFGIVRIEDDVEIGANTTVDRAMIGATVIGEGTKIDNLVMIAHNCELGQHNLLASQTGFAGSVTSGEYVVCAGQVGIADHVHLGAGAILAAQSGIPKTIPGGKTYMGSPAQPDKEAHKQYVASRRLPKMLTQFREMAAQIETLKSQIQELKSSTPSDEGCSDSAKAA